MKKRGRFPKKDIHHFYNPKRLYKDSENIFIKLDYDFHHNYHQFFDAHCYSPMFRHCETCDYRDICCYRGTGITYGERIPH